MTMRYSHLTDPYLRTAVDAVNLGASKLDGAEQKSA
jgi:hypothetical protein